MSEPVHFVHKSLYERLSSLDPLEVSRRSLVRYDGQRFLIPFLNDLYALDPQGALIVLSGRKVTPELEVSILEYLIGAKQIEPQGRWLSMKDLKGGRGFVQSHPLPLEGLLQKYGRAPQAFLKKGVELGGEVKRVGDAGIILRPLPRIPMLLVLWKGDEEFPPRLNVLFDPTAQEHLRLDALYGLAIEVIRRYSS